MLRSTTRSPGQVIGHYEKAKATFLLQFMNFPASKMLDAFDIYIMYEAE